MLSGEENVEVAHETSQDEKDDNLRALLPLLMTKYNGSFLKINQELARSWPGLHFGSRATFYRKLAALSIDGPRKGAVRGPALNAAIHTLAGPDTMRGYKGTHHALALQGVATTQQAVLHALRDLDPDALQQRGLKPKKTIHRSPIVSAGPDEQWSVDGHDKLSHFGFGIYGIRDVYSGKILALHAFRSNRKAVNVHWLYLRTVFQAGGIPIQIASDRGGETSLMSASQSLYRQICSAPDLSEVPPCIYLQSTRNITIERAWVGVRNEVVDLMKAKFEEGLQKDFVSTNPVHCALFWWIFAPLVQQALDRHCKYHNTFKGRRQKKKVNPSGEVRDSVYSAPEQWGGIQCLQKMSNDQITELKGAVEEAEAEAELGWVTAEVNDVCCQAYNGLGVSRLEMNLDNAWMTFSALLPWVREPLQSLVEM